MSLLNRLTKSEDPNIGLHGFNAAIREYARGAKTKAEIESAYSILSTDPQWAKIILLIDGQTGTAKLLKAFEIGDVLELFEGRDSNPLYPTAASIATRFGL